MRRKTLTALALLLSGFISGAGCSSYQKGLVHTRFDRHAAAVEQFEKVLQEDSNHIDARRRLAYALLKDGRNGEAIAHFRHVLAYKPADLFSAYYLGIGYRESGQNDKAVATWRDYRNPEQPFLAEELARLAKFVDICDCVELARRSLVREQELNTQPPRPDVIAVFGYKDMSPDGRFAHFEKALASLIIADLAQLKSIKVVDRLKIQQLLAEAKLGGTDLVEPGRAIRTGRLLGAEHLISGTLDSEDLRVQTSLASTSRSEVVSAFSISGDPKRFFELQKEIVYHIVKLLKVPLNAEEKARIGAYHTEDLAAVIHFGQGLEAMDAGNREEAHRHFSIASDRDPGFGLAKRYRDGCPSAATASLAAFEALRAEPGIRWAGDDTVAVNPALAWKLARGEP